MINQIVNMKKRLLLLLLMMALMPLSYHVMAQTINFKVGYVDPQNPFEEDHRSPVLIPEVEIEGYTLFESLDYSKLEWDMAIINAQSGKKVYEGRITGLSQSIDTNGWNKGIYIIQIKMGEQSISKKVIIKE